MNKKAEAFQAYLEKNKIEFFVAQEVEDELNTTIFRSSFDIDGEQLPALIILDDTIFGIVRTLIAPQALKGGNKEALLELINGYNQQFKAFKYYLLESGELVLDTSVLLPDEAVNGDLFDAILRLTLEHLTETHAKTMQTIWAPKAQA